MSSLEGERCCGALGVIACQLASWTAARRRPLLSQCAPANQRKSAQVMEILTMLLSASFFYSRYPGQNARPHRCWSPHGSPRSRTPFLGSTACASTLTRPPQVRSQCLPGTSSPVVTSAWWSGSLQCLLWCSKTTYVGHHVTGYPRRVAALHNIFVVDSRNEHP